MKRMRQNLITRNIIYKKISNEVPQCVLHGEKINYDEDIKNFSDEQIYKLVQNEKRLTNTLYISFPGIEANLILDMLSEKVACSAGAACHSEGFHMSHVLEAMGISKNVAMGTLRISTGIQTSQKDAEDGAKYIIEVVHKLMPKDKDDEQSSLDNKEEENINNCRLTKNTHGMGCGCKISPKLLQEILSELPPQKKKIKYNENILVDNNTFDDAGVFDLTSFYNSTTEEQINKKEIALVSTVDFFTPICDNAYDYGAISCANALSDIYAMGGKPLNALSIVAFPVTLLPHIVLKEILRGASEKADEADCVILGGHSIDDNEPKFGLSVNGLVDKKKIWRNNTVKKNNFILLTKKIGTGIIMTSLKKDIIDKNDQLVVDAITSMKTLNKYHSEIIINNDIKIDACTDVTGFGLLGHLAECLLGDENKNFLAEIVYSKIPFIGEKVKELANMNMSPGGAKSNLTYVEGKVLYDKNISNQEKLLINDPQTSGGLLIFTPEDSKKTLLELYRKNNLNCFEIGRIIERPQNIESKYCIKINKD